MKKSVFVFISIIIVIAGVSAYSVLKGNFRARVVNNKSNVKEVEAKRRPKPTKNQAKKPETKNIDKRNILFTSNSDASLRVLHATVDEYFRDDAVDAIVEGNVSAVENAYLGRGGEFTVLTIDVLNTFKGTTPKTIKVYEDGGYVKFKDMLPDFEGHIDMSKISTEQIENGIVDVKFFGAPHSKPGQQMVLFLSKNPIPGLNDTFQVVSSIYGRFILDKNTGSYKRLALDSGNDPADTSAKFMKKGSLETNFEDSIPKAEMGSRLRNIK